MQSFSTLNSSDVFYQVEPKTDTSRYAFGELVPEKGAPGDKSKALS